MLQYKYPTTFYKKAIDPYITPSHLCTIDQNNSFICNGSELAHLTYSTRGVKSEDVHKIDINHISTIDLNCNIQSIIKINQTKQEVVVGLVDSSSNVSIYKKYLNEDNYNTNICTDIDTDITIKNANKRMKIDNIDKTTKTTTTDQVMTSKSNQTIANYGYADLCMINNNICCSMHHYSKTIQWIDINTVTSMRSIYCNSNPTTICSFNNTNTNSTNSNTNGNTNTGNVAMIAQGGSFAVYDHRQNELGTVVVLVVVLVVIVGVVVIVIVFVV